MKTLLSLGSLLLLILTAALPASLITNYDFQQITQNGLPSNYPYLDFSLGVSQIDDQQVQFHFLNESTINSVVTDIFFEAGPFASIAQIVSGPNTSFALITKNLNFPGGNLLTPKFVEAYGVGAVSPSTKNGLAVGEYMDVIFTLNSSYSYDDLISELNEKNTRVGIHVQSIGSDATSESFIATPPPIIPEPMTCLLLAIGSMALIRRHR